MAQIAIQDHIYLEVTESEGALVFDKAQQEKLVECFENGTVLDVVARISGARIARLVGATKAVVDSTTTYKFGFGDTDSVLETEIEVA